MKTTITQHGGLIYQAARRWGVRPEEILDFSANINPAGPPASVAKVFEGSVTTVTAYPDEEESRLSLATKNSVRPEEIIIGNGSTALIFAVVRAVMPKRALLIEPAFGEYYRALWSVGAQVDTIGLDECNDFGLDFSALCSALTTNRYDLVVLNNPHNPSGTLSSAADIMEFASACAQLGTTIMLDEAFIDYAFQDSISREAPGKLNLVVLRSLTKFYAIPAMRVGYAVCNRDFASRLQAQIEGWPVSGIALDIARAVIGDTAYEKTSRNANASARAEFTVALGRMPWIKVFPSAANFLLLKLSKGTGSSLARFLEPHHVLIRQCGSFVGLGDNFIRVAVRSPSDNMKLVKLIEQWESEFAICT